ncbi:MAG TPA: SDR family NAD(P)-dependent oxidoreductase [Chlamydiales bacterium]|jgi:NAD(P)-dependent dehydrogenase (short-subunit alcohol dehydrogenase family)|nr:SDR family NAD(P)-dependent oxidoreductase [Chlamydiales bacterium]
MSTISNDTIVVVGGSRGIGLLVAEACLKEGVATLIIVSPNEADLNKALLRLKQGYHKRESKIVGYVSNLTDPAALEECANRLQRVDHIIWASHHGIAHERSKSVFNILSLLFLNNDIGVFTEDCSSIEKFWGPIILTQTANVNFGGSLTITLAHGTAGDDMSQNSMEIVDTLSRSLTVELAPVRVNFVCSGLVSFPGNFLVCGLLMSNIRFMKRSVITFPVPNCPFNMYFWSVMERCSHYFSRIVLRSSGCRTFANRLNRAK